MWKIAEQPANYTDEDPLDMQGTMGVVNDLHSDWAQESWEGQRQTVANAFRAALTSPRQNLKWNSIIYQDLMHIPADESNPDVFEQAIRDKKAKWDTFGQQTLDLVNTHGTQTNDPEYVDYGARMLEKYQPGIWKNIRNCAIIGPYIDQLTQLALEDLRQGGTGQYFRQGVMALNIPGIGPKITAFVWLLLAPKTSQLATIDIHMMRVLGQEAQSPKDYNAYQQFENQLSQRKDEMGYQDAPLGAFQWGLWDKQRTPGYHQDHSALRPHNPTDWRDVDWAQTQRPDRTPDYTQPQEQLSLGSNWKSTSWQMYRY
jgi:hypothetical protein